MKRPTDEQLSKLPKYAQAYIQDLERHRDNILSNMRKMEDDQPKSKVWMEEFVYTGEAPGVNTIVRYFPCDSLVIESAGVRLSIHGLWDDKEIQLSWRPAGPGLPLGDVLFIPTSYQQAKLTSVENAR